MEEQSASKFRFEEIDNGANILLLLRSCHTWEELAARFEHVDPLNLIDNSNSVSLLNKLRKLKELGFIKFEEQAEAGKPGPGAITVTERWAEIQLGLGGPSLSDLAKLPRSAQGMAVKPFFGRPAPPDEPADVFVLMPFKTELASVYKEHIKKLGKKLGVTISRADDSFSPRSFMTKVWEGICAARLIIADCTERNPNVFYEIGMAHTVGKRVVLITRSQDDIPSDIKHIDYIEYTYDPEGTKALINKLADVIRKELRL